MNDFVEKCQECREPLKDSQYSHLKREGDSAVKMKDSLVCRNYPICKKSEKEV